MLVARSVVIHSREEGGFNMVAIALKVNALLVEWFRRFRTTPNSWVSLMTFWFFDHFGADPVRVFSQPDGLPPFYASLLKAWKALNGSATSQGLVVRSLDGSPDLLIDSSSCKASICWVLPLILAGLIVLINLGSPLATLTGLPHGNPYLLCPWIGKPLI